MPEAPPAAVIPCIHDDGLVECGALVQDQPQDRQKHRAWHAHEEQVKDGFRTVIKRQNGVIAKLAHRLTEMEARMSELEGDVQGIEIPVPVPPLRVSTDGWSDDDGPGELPPLQDDDDTLEELEALEAHERVPLADIFNRPATASSGSYEPATATVHG